MTERFEVMRVYDDGSIGLSAKHETEKEAWERLKDLGHARPTSTYEVHKVVEERTRLERPAVWEKDKVYLYGLRGANRMWTVVHVWPSGNALAVHTDGESHEFLPSERKDWTEVSS